MCFRASPFLVLKVVGGVVGVVLGCAHRARRVSSLRFSAIFASGRCIWCYSILQGGIRRQEQKTKLKNSLIQPRTSQKKFSLFENALRALRALRAFPKGKKHQKLRTFGYPPFMQKLSMQAEKRRLHAVPSCGSDRLKRHFREGSVAGISHIRKACAPRKP